MDLKRQSLANFGVAVACVLAATFAHASPWISEYSRTPRQALATNGVDLHEIPAYIEISGIDPAGQYELVVINSTDTGNFGLVKNIVAINGGPAVQIITDGVWPLDVAPRPFAPSGMFHESIVGDSLTFPFTTGILLFEGSTGAAIGPFFPDPQDLPGGAALLDSIAFGQPGTGRSYDGSNVYDMTSGDVILRVGPQPPDDDTLVLIGDVDPSGSFIGLDPGYLVQPGIANGGWSPLDVPEPGALSAMLLAILLTSRRAIWRGI